MDFQKEAFKTWENFYNPDTDSKNQLVNYVNGTLGCFCSDQYRAEGFNVVFKSFREDGLDQLPPSILRQVEQKEEASETEVESRQICKQYVIYEKFSSSYYWLISFSIIIYNGLFYTLVVPMVKLVGFHKKSDENWLSCFMIFLCLVVDMILLPIFIGMNLVEVSDNKISKSIFTGKHTDFEGDWYKDIGQQIMITMTIFAFQPVIDFLVEYLLLRLFRVYYRNAVHSRHRSEQSKMNIQNDFLVFLDLHAGPEYAFYYKCANTNLVVFICLIFGGCMPLLYFIGMFAIAMSYFMDRLALTYFYRLPPKFSEKLNIDSLKLMSLAPLFGLMILVWQYTNRQMFENSIDKISTQNELILSHHFIKDTLKWSRLQQCQRALLVVICLVFVFLVVQEMVRQYRKRVKPAGKLQI